MGFIIIIVLLVLGFFGVVAWLAIGLSVKVDSDQRKAERNSEQILDEAFDGRTDVTFKTHLRSLKFETVVAGAKDRGYHLAHQAQDSPGAMTLMFEKGDEPARG